MGDEKANDNNREFIRLLESTSDDPDISDEIYMAVSGILKFADKVDRIYCAKKANKDWGD